MPMRRTVVALLAMVVVGIVAGSRHAAAEDRVSEWQGFERRDFQVDGRDCLLIVPKTPAPGKPWIWRTEFFGHEPQADLALASKGFHIAYIDVQNMYGAPVALDHMDRFYDHLTRERGLAAKTVLEGFSRGGLFSLNWAARHPDRVACIYNDAPVCDFKSWPAGRGRAKASPSDWQRCLAVYHLTEEEALAYRLNPVDNLAPLAKEKIALLHVCGEADDVVPIEENTRLLERRYRELGGPITVIAKPGVGHHPHSLVDPAPIVAFVLEHTIGKASAAILPESPAEYQVFQRASHAMGTIRVRGTVSGTAGELEARVIRTATAASAEAVILDWQPIAPDPQSNRFAAELAVPAGGWYRVELRLAHKLDAGVDQPVVATAIEHVGVGEVFVVAGQSNSTNWGSQRQSTRTGMVSSFDGSHWVLANDPQPGVQDGSQGGSFLPAFGDALYEHCQVPIGIASTGAGGTSVRQWLPKGEQMTNLPTVPSLVREVRPGVWESTGELFAGLAQRLDALGPRGCRAVLWHQGESDAGQARAGYPADRQISGKQYADFMAKLVAASRKQAQWDVPWFTAQTTYHNPADAADDEFRAAQRSLWETGLTLAGPDTDALGLEYRDGNHFNAKGLAAHGRLWADRVAAYLDAQPRDEKTR
ncbi:MAG TPA: alpha/beta fold hydrolase [Pirellulales bacterium]|jgi:pimeloyl-ACP methyl ester carboxylesterase|nr:alpha/beta fold hydrolase [Pirellulales bacterium]